MTCLFWFESIEELKKAESIRSRLPNAPIPRLPPLARPHEQFRKWVYNVLSTTQVTQNVIFLALLFIYRLKMSTPQIKGRAGSEYRLLTVALMLGNKCTYNTVPAHRHGNEADRRLTLWGQFWTIIHTRTRPGLKFHASPSKKFTSWRWNS